MQVENEHTFRKSLTEGVNLFLGSGFPVLAEDEDGNALPTGGELGAELADEFSLGDASALDLSQMCTIIQHTDPRGLRAYLTKRFSVKRFDRRYKALERCRVETIFTTNIDDLLYKVFERSTERYLNDLDSRGPAHSDRTAVDLVTLHGCVRDQHRPLTFATLDLAAAFRSDPDRWHSLTERIQRYPTLFWGYGMRDPGTQEALSGVTVRGRKHHDKWIVLRPSDASPAAVQYFKAVGFQIIRADTARMLDYLASDEVAAAPAPLPPPTAATRELFPEEAVPDIAAVPSRPIMEFYLGDAPQWCDIFSGRLHQTEHFSRVRDSINSGKHTIVIGLPACGKTTLLMQAAAEIPYAGHKLVSGGLTPEKARLVRSRLRGANAMVFIDNFTDSMDAFELLAAEPNVLVAAFDRDYNFQMLLHRIDSERCNVLDVTELSRPDIQAILAAIPQQIKRREDRPFRTSPGVQPSVFEIIESNITQPTLEQRWATVLRGLQEQAPNLLSLVLVCSYVHGCRTPVSMDMLIAFFRDIVKDHNEIYAMVDEAGATLSEYVGPLVDEEQDHYVPRSTTVAEAIIRRASDSALRAVLQRFHTNVTPYRICRFDVFRRRGYDADLMVRAFPEWQAGRVFYEQIHARDGSPYILQQGALYLSRKKRHREAFQWIDTAVLDSGGQIWSIRNSHAIILFEANIEHPDHDSETVRRTLHQSMQILARCYESDRRRVFHAIRFADQALRYRNVYGHDAARRYLERARGWLINEAQASPWSRGVRYLLPRVERALGM